MTTRTAGPAAARGPRARPSRRVSRCALAALALIVIGCSAPTVVVPSPTPTATPTATASPAVSPTASPRALPQFTGVLPFAPAAEPMWLAPDRGRIAYVPESGELIVLDVTTGQERTLHRPQDGWHVELDGDGLRGDTLVFLETRTDGQRTDGRIRRVDLRSNDVVTLDDFSGPFLGGGDTWRPRPPVTNGRDVAWIRVDSDRAPFGVHVVYTRPGAETWVPHSGTSIVWIDLHDDGRFLVSKLITGNQLAELQLWSGGHPTPLGNRPSADGGPAHFVGDRVYWQVGSGIVAQPKRGELIVPFGEVRPLDHPDCAVLGTTGRFLLEACPSSPPDASGNRTYAARLHEPVSGGLSSIPGNGHRAGRSAVAWREGTQWWIGTIAP